MNITHAKQIAELLNTRNQLVKVYTPKMVKERANDFIYELDNNSVIACIEVKKVQWYQCEVCHLTVDSDNEGQGLGNRMIRKAESKAKKDGARIIQCTIRAGNNPSKYIFEKNGYKKVSEFYYPYSENDVSVWQKIISKK